MRRGDIYWINLEPSSPPEFGKTRPGLIISNSEQNNILTTVVMLPLSTQAPEIWPLRIALERPLIRSKPSFVVLPGIRQVSKERLDERIGAATETLLKRLEDALEIYLGD